MHIFVKSQTIPKVRRETVTTNETFTASPVARNTQFLSGEAGPCRPSTERLPSLVSGQAEGKRVRILLDFNRKTKRKKLSTIKGCKLHID